MKWQKSNVHQIALAGILLGLTVAIGSWLWFPLWGGTIYLVGACIFLLPLFLPMGLVAMTAGAAVVLVDLVSGYFSLSWISLIAYVGAVILLRSIFLISGTRVAYILTLIVAMAWVIGVYFYFDLLLFGPSYALANVTITALQFAICGPICVALFFPCYIISLGVNKWTNTK